MGGWTDWQRDSWEEGQTDSVIPVTTPVLRWAGIITLFILANCSVMWDIKFVICFHLPNFVPVALYLSISDWYVMVVMLVWFPSRCITSTSFSITKTGIHFDSSVLDNYHWRRCFGSPCDCNGSFQTVSCTRNPLVHAELHGMDLCCSWKLSEKKYRSMSIFPQFILTIQRKRLFVVTYNIVQYILILRYLSQTKTRASRFHSPR